MQPLRVFSLASQPQRQANLQTILPVLLAQADVLHLHWVGYNEPIQHTFHDPKIIHHHWEKAGSQIRLQPYNLYKNAYFFSVDDDILYPPNYADKLIESMQQYNNRVVCCVHGDNPNLSQRGEFFIRNRKNVYYKNALAANRRVLLPGTGTTCFYTPNVQLNFDDFKVNNMTDIYTGCFLAKQHIPVVAIKRETMWLSSLNDFGIRIFGNNPHEAIDALLNKYRWYFIFNRYWFKLRYKI